MSPHTVAALNCYGNESSVDIIFFAFFAAEFSGKNSVFVGKKRLRDESCVAPYEMRGKTIHRVLPMKPYNFRRSIKFEIHCPNL